jgi:hypothetical protein
MVGAAWLEQAALDGHLLDPAQIRSPPVVADADGEAPAAGGEL